MTPFAYELWSQVLSCGEKSFKINAKHITFTLKEGNIHPGITDNKDTLWAK